MGKILLEPMPLKKWPGTGVLDLITHKGGQTFPLKNGDEFEVKRCFSI